MPAASARATFFGGLGRGEYTQAQLFDYAAKLDATGAKIGLTGLQGGGLAHTEFLALLTEARTGSRRDDSDSCPEDTHGSAASRR